MGQEMEMKVGRRGPRRGAGGRAGSKAGGELHAQKQQYLFCCHRENLQLVKQAHLMQCGNTPIKKLLSQCGVTAMVSVSCVSVINRMRHDRRCMMCPSHVEPHQVLLSCIGLAARGLQAVPADSSPDHLPKGTGPSSFESPLETKFASRKL